jgi:hemolysin activation/secretion protein
MRSLTLSLAAFLSLCGVALAQQPRQSGPVDQSLEKKKDPKEDPNKPKPKIELEKRAEMTSEDDAKVRIKVERLKVVGNKSVPEADLLDIARAPGGVVGKEMTLAELKQAANRITGLYRDQGFGLAWAYIPVQDIKNGVVEIAVVEGRVDKILVSGNAHYSAEFIIDHVERLQKQDTLSLDTLEQGLLILNTYPGLSVQSTLRQGDTLGTTDLYLTATDKFPISASLDFDNYGPMATGAVRLGATVTAFNLFDEGHWLTVRGVSSLDRADGETVNGRIEYTVPFRNGTKLSAYASLYEYHAKGAVGPIDPTGTGEIFGVLLTDSLYLNHIWNVEATMGLEYKSLKQVLVSVQNGRDELRVFSLGVSMEVTDELEGRWVVAPSLRQGLGSFLGGLKAGDPSSSRAGADDAFTRLDLTAYRLQKITSWFHLVGKISCEWVPHQVVSSEQFALGGADSVRGYAPFEFMGDKGFVMTLEARLGLPFMGTVKDPFRDGRSLEDTVQIVGFLDSGQAWRINPQPGETGWRIMTGAGPGIRINYPDIISVRFDVGFPITSQVSSTGFRTFYYVSAILNLH